MTQRPVEEIAKKIWRYCVKLPQDDQRKYFIGLMKEALLSERQAAAKAVLKEREACAKVAEKMNYAPNSGFGRGAKDIAQAIRQSRKGK